MNHASGLLHRTVDRVAHHGPALIIVAVALMMVAFVGVLLVADLLGSASEPITAAPFRWYYSR